MTLGWLALLPPQSNAILNETQIAQLEDLRRNNAVFHEALAVRIRSSTVYIRMTLERTFGEIRKLYPMACKNELFTELCRDLCNCVVRLESGDPSPDPHNIAEEVDSILLGLIDETDRQDEMIGVSESFSPQVQTLADAVIL